MQVWYCWDMNKCFLLGIVINLMLLKVKLHLTDYLIHIKERVEGEMEKQSVNRVERSKLI